MSGSKRPDDPFRRLVRMEQVLWLAFTWIVPVAIVGAAWLFLRSVGAPLLSPALAMAIALGASAATLVVSIMIGRNMTTPDRLDAVQHQLLPAIDGSDSDTSVPEPMRQAYRQAAYLHRIALMQFALADTAVMAGLLLTLLATDLLPAILGAAAAVIHGLIHRPRLRGFLRERGRVEP
jgi:hypothetical protein